jgi:hypothetical protein
MNLSNIPQKARWNIIQSLLNDNFQKIVVELARASATTKTYFTSEDALNTALPNAQDGDIAFVGETFPGTVYEYKDGAWTNTEIPASAVTSLADYATKVELKEDKQELANLIAKLTPQRVESEAAMQAMIQSGQYDEQQIYYVAE